MKIFCNEHIQKYININIKSGTLDNILKLLSFIIARIRTFSYYYILEYININNKIYLAYFC